MWARWWKLSFCLRICHICKAKSVTRGCQRVSGGASKSDPRRSDPRYIQIERVRMRTQINSVPSPSGQRPPPPDEDHMLGLVVVCLDVSSQLHRCPRAAEQRTEDRGRGSQDRNRSLLPRFMVEMRFPATASASSALQRLHDIVGDATRPHF